ATCGLLFPLFLVHGDHHGMDLIMTVAVMCALWQFVLVIPHELGHALAAWLLGVPAYAIQIGEEPWLLNRDVAGMRWRISRYLGGGITFHGPCEGPNARGNAMLITFAGPLTNLLIAAGAFLWVDENGGLSGGISQLVWLTLGISSGVQF